MPPIYDSDLLLITHHFKHDLLAREAVITFAANSSGGTNTAQQLAEDFQTLAANSFDDVLDQTVQLMRTTTLKGNGTTAFTVGTSTSPARRGIPNNATVPSNTAVLVQKRTLLGGRRGRGRVYLPWFLPETQVDEIGGISTSQQGIVQLAMDNYYAGYGGVMMLAGRTYDLPWDNPNRQLLAVTSGPLVNALVVSPIAATQRRRMPRS